MASPAEPEPGSEPEPELHENEKPLEEMDSELGICLIRLTVGASRVV